MLKNSVAMVKHVMLHSLPIQAHLPTIGRHMISGMTRMSIEILILGSILQVEYSTGCAENQFLLAQPVVINPRPLFSHKCHEQSQLNVCQWD